MMEIILCGIYMFLFHVESICFYFMWNLYVFISYGNEHISHRVTSYNRKSKILGKADSQLNHKTPQLCRDVITNSYCVNVMRQPYDLYLPIKNVPIYYFFR